MGPTRCNLAEKLCVQVKKKNKNQFKLKLILIMKASTKKKASFECLMIQYSIYFNYST